MKKYVLVVLMILATTSAFAQTSYEPFSKVSTVPNVVMSIKRLTDDNLDKGHDKAGHSLAPITAEERAKGVIPPDAMKRAIDHGSFTAYDEWCGNTDWEEKTYLPFMKQERDNGKWTDRQLAYIGMMHGISMGFVGKELRKISGGCQQKDRTNVEAYRSMTVGKK
jgi:hypothetical protein